jgi:NAD(P)-dependent dehydrogenase (short-subunit alcohol dehydrogenase family)
MTRPVAVVTGAAQGIGLEVARRLSATHRVVLLDLNAQALPQAAAVCGDDALHRACDITHPDQVRDAVAWVVQEAGGIDVLISNAGVAVAGALRHLDPDTLAAQLNVNLTGNWRVIHACLPHIEARRGYVMGVASASAIAPAVGLGPYGSSKAGLEMLLDILRVEVAHLGVDVGVAYFLWIKTDMVEGADRDMAAFAAMRSAMAGPLRTTHPVEDAAQAIVEGVHARSRAVYAPKWLRFLSPVRMVLRTRLGERDARAVAPELDRLTAERVAQVGAFDAALRDTVASEAAAESAGHHLHEQA